MFKHSTTAFFSILLLGLFVHVAEAKDYPFSLESLQIQNGHQLIAHNKGPVPMSTIVSIVESQNLSSNQHWPVISVVPPYSSINIGVVYPTDPVSGYSFETSTTIRPGVIGAQHDPDALYRMPYPDGQTFTISQAPGAAITTHNTPENQFAVDIMMPEGTPILAARNGIVMEVEDEHTEGGKDSQLVSQANAVRILHGDGTIATYAHLKQGGIAVKAGQEIKAGEMIGYSGSTGYASGPHLHFVVSKVVETNGVLSDASVPIKFYVGKPKVAFEPRTGMRVTANYSSGTDPAKSDQSNIGGADVEANPTPGGQCDSSRNDSAPIQKPDKDATGIQIKRRE